MQALGVRRCIWMLFSPAGLSSVGLIRAVISLGSIRGGDGLPMKESWWTRKCWCAGSCLQAFTCSGTAPRLKEPSRWLLRPANERLNSLSLTFLFYFPGNGNLELMVTQTKAKVKKRVSEISPSWREFRKKTKTGKPTRWMEAPKRMIKLCRSTLLNFKRFY